MNLTCTHLFYHSHCVHAAFLFATLAYFVVVLFEFPPQILTCYARDNCFYILHFPVYKLNFQDLRISPKIGPQLLQESKLENQAPVK